jgi:phosphoadenosine phosphosulfate reductase
MSPPDPVTAAENSRSLTELNRWLEAQDAKARVAWTIEHLSGPQVLSSSFGAQAAVALHLVTREKPDIPVLLVDTGYLFPETYRFIDELRERLDLDLHVVRPELSAAWLEARHGRLWEQGIDGIEAYNRIAKVEPLRRALDAMGARTWFTGLRRSQSSTRAEAPLLSIRDGRWKLNPIVDWSDRDIGRYLARHDLPWHPLWHQGYVSIGDTHTTTRWHPGMREEDTRFFGLKRECGIHLEV